MNQIDKITLTIEAGAQTIRMDSEENGIRSSKLIGLDDLAGCFLRSKQQPMLHSGLLPPGCLSYSEGEEGWCGITLLFPERYCDFTYHETTYPHFPLPRLVFRFSLYRGRRVRDVFAGVVEEGRITPESKMYCYPFSNVKGYRMCTGGNTLPGYDSLHGISSLPYLILSMPNNDDYYSVRNNREGLEFRDLLEHLKDKDPGRYYTDVLIPNGDTLQDFITLK